MSRLSRGTLIAIALLIATALGSAKAEAALRAPELKLVAPDSIEPGEGGLFRTFFFNDTDRQLDGPLTVTWSVSGDATISSGNPFISSADSVHFNFVESSECSPGGSTQTCTVNLTSREVPPGVTIYQNGATLLTPGPAASGEVKVSVALSAPGLPALKAERTIDVGPPLPYRIAEWEASAVGAEESQRLSAGATPDRIDSNLRPTSFSQRLLGVEPRVGLRESIRNGIVHLPPGLIGNPQAVPYCRYVDFARSYNTPECPPDTQVGIFKGIVKGAPFVTPLFNLEPAPGEAARFGISFVAVPSVLDARLRSGDYGVDISSTNTNTTFSIQQPEYEFWGVPGDPRHDAVRASCLSSSAGGRGEICPASIGRTSFLRLPTRCTGEPLPFPLELSTWENPDLIHRASAELSPVQDCENVPFGPELTTTPSSLEAETPSGLSATVQVPNQGLLNPDAISDSDVRSARVALPQGITLNPSQAEGLGVCTQAQYESSELSFHPDGTKGCPSDSKIGTVAVHTPVLKETIPGNVYIAEPYRNPFNSLLAIYVVLEEPMRGILVKLPAKVEPDEKTGRIVTTFDDLPQLPFSSFEFKFREGARAPLVTPPTCGTYTTEAQFTPWADPSETFVSKSSFQISKGTAGGPCPPAGTPGFEPGFSAGSVNNNAGSFSEFLMRLTRLDGEQDMTKFNSVLPPGVVAKLAGVAKCSDQAIAQAKAKTGTEEKANPSCPADSQIGRTLVGAGVGSVLTHVPGRLYLAGPYHGAPLSVAAITPAVAGPFDVGTVVVQQALNLDPATAEVHVDGDRSDPIPHILKGIPLKLRDLRVYVDREDFTLNPTSCDPYRVQATLFGSGADVFNPADDPSVNLSSRYQAANCTKLGFKPKLSLRLKGGTKRGGHPALRAVFRSRAGDANLARAVVRLPRSAFLDQAHIGTICTRVQWAQDACPKASIYGRAEAFTPLLDEPLEGPVYLRSSNHKLPDLVLLLHGIVDVEAVGRIDSQHGGIRTSFEGVPDAPVSKVILTMQGGKKGLIVNSRNLCGSRNRAAVEFEGQNGKVSRIDPELAPDCGGKRRHKTRHI